MTTKTLLKIGLYQKNVYPAQKHIYGKVLRFVLIIDEKIKYCKRGVCIYYNFMIF